ncbi:helix-turn-helix transcriptional regulator [Treponema sp. R80B11-R83G3]
MTTAWTDRPAGYKLKTRALLMLIIHRLNEILMDNTDNMMTDFRVNKIIRFIAMHYFDKITVKELAKMVHMHRVNLGRLFKHQMGMSINKYITKIRVRNAEMMLQSGDNVQDVAEHCGFSDVSYFSKLFKKIRGFPPSKCTPEKQSE